MDAMSTGESFQRFNGFSRRSRKRRRCSSWLTASQNLMMCVPPLMSDCSKPVTSLRKISVCSGVQNPITGSTTARLYQERSKKQISPGLGRCAQ